MRSDEYYNKEIGCRGRTCKIVINCILERFKENFYTEDSEVGSDNNMKGENTVSGRNSVCQFTYNDRE